MSTRYLQRLENKLSELGLQREYNLFYEVIRLGIHESQLVIENIISNNKL